MSLEICRICNLDADDSIHLASAIGSGCDTFVTSDNFLRREGKRLIKIHNKVPESEKKVHLKFVAPDEALKLVNSQIVKKNFSVENVSSENTG